MFNCVFFKENIMNLFNGYELFESDYLQVAGVKVRSRLTKRIKTMRSKQRPLYVTKAQIVNIGGKMYAHPLTIKRLIGD